MMAAPLPEKPAAMATAESAPAPPPTSSAQTVAAAAAEAEPDFKAGSVPVPVADAEPTKVATDPAPQPTVQTAATANGASVPVEKVSTESAERPLAHHDDDSTNPADFDGAVDSNNDLPTAETLARIDDYVVLDRDRKTHTFRSLYTGKHCARRVLIIFVRHFYCGNCQEYLRALSSSSITPDALLRLPISTMIAVVGCGDPGLIDMYASATNCPFPIYADPTRRLYAELGMIRTLALGARPAYTTQNLLKSSLASVVQGLKQVKHGRATKGGDARQVGGEFLFEPMELQSPVTTPWGDGEKSAMGGFPFVKGGGPEKRSSDTSLDGKGEDYDGRGVEEKRVTWCHRMRTTRDHAEIPELMEVLGLDGTGMPIKDLKRWSRAVETRKGTGLSMAGQMSAMKAQAGTVS
ncbi:thioredoxin-like protein AAED1 [Echria macrotheca]|uniref:Thioredoxin-like protein AAED1 n=1 Tax=Echria macrotheca TaxID=438768 RepID=A0AAJ0F9T1_9PEZI|nr:thioredoxin-like protein AAED1 [Echria macrotheca]